MAASLNVSQVVGQRYGRLVVTADLGVQPPGRDGKRYVSARCDCGSKRAHVRLASLKGGITKSCGCLQRERSIKANTSHGMSTRSEFHAWVNIIQRCTNMNRPRYCDYGGRGITVCARWRQSFGAFFADMGQRPSASHSIDRIDNGGNYESGNCRWATQHEQAGNARSNRWIEFQGQRMILADWARHIGVHQGTLHARLKKGWPLERALTERSHR